MLKADLHIHTKEDHHDKYIRYTARELVNHAYHMGFDVLAITHHWFPKSSDKIFYNKSIIDYAKKKDILLIPGVEARIKVSRMGILRKDVLLYNFTQDELNQIESLEDVKTIKQNHHLVIAPHPFFPHPKLISLGNKWLKKYIDVFDAIEHAYFYTKDINFNAMAVKIAKKYNKPLVGNSDVHQIRYMGSNYSLIKAKPTINAVISAIKNNKVQLKTKPISLYSFSMRTVPIAIEIAYNFYSLTKKIFRVNKKKNL